MSTAATSRNPSLLAILLVVQGRIGSGAEVVFHYPPDPCSAEYAADPNDSTEEGDDESSSSDTESSSSEDDLDLFTRRGKSENTIKAEPTHDTRSQQSDEEEGQHLTKRGTQDSGDWRPSWEPLLGLGEDGLVSLLAPGRAWHKRKFELGINDLTFIGRPVYAREDGFWSKPKSKKPTAAEAEDVAQSTDSASGVNGRDEEPGPRHDTIPTDEAGQEEEEGEEEPKDRKQHHRPDSKRSQLTMFHMVFVMDPPPLEHSVRVKEMYDHVVKKFSKVLKWEQSHHDYVWQQSELLQSIRSKHFHQQSSAKVLYTEIMQRSSLATAIARVFENISASKIAAIRLSSKLSVSLQIPPVTSTSYLPSLTEPPLQPGLWLTTATDSIATGSDLDATGSAGALQLSKNFTLLLKSNPRKILSDIQATGGPLAMPLANFLGKAKATKSFYKISLASQIPLGDIQHLARHLIYWRRAIAIPPLHQRDTYIVSPNANMAKLVSACKSYDVAFPMMPSLPRVLNALSGTPVPYGTLIPSSDHKEEYYRLLAWLMRDGWVTALRTFAYVRVDPQVKKAAREKEREDSRGFKTPVEQDPGDRERGLAKSFTSGTPTSSSVPSFRQRPSMVSRPSSDGRASVSTDHTSARGAQQFKHNPKAASLILSPQRASPEESRWLDYIGRTLVAAVSPSPSSSEQPTMSSSFSTPHPTAAADLSQSPDAVEPLPTSPPNHFETPSPSSSFSPSPTDESPVLVDTEAAELRRYWPVFVKYFTGTEALERIAVREGLKRKFVWDMLIKMGLLTGPEDEGQEGGGGKVKGTRNVLLTVRHW